MTQPQALPPSHPDFYTQVLQFTPTVHRSVPPSLQPDSPFLQAAAAGKHVLITGAGSGFGRAAALQWARSGCAGIVLCGRRRAALEFVGREVAAVATRRQVAVVVSEGDVSVERDVDKIFEIAATQLPGHIDVVIHSAGVLGPMASIGDVDAAQWWDAVVRALLPARLPQN
jgi:NAD(P)-dependent dehydrogenase (short-subunit alcohol dehydrogenase family)